MKRILLSLLFTAFFAVPAWAGDMEMPMHEHMGGRGPIMESGSMDRMGEMMGMCLEHAQELGLTDEQVKKITPIHREMKKLLIRFNADLKLAEMERMETMEVKDFDLDKAIAEDKKIAGMKTAHHADMLKMMKQVRTLLTDEQFRKIKEMGPMKMKEMMMDKELMHMH
jgi:Spy/CpxP family protein refolding chaperone